VTVYVQSYIVGTSNDTDMTSHWNVKPDGQKCATCTHHVWTHSRQHV